MAELIYNGISYEDEIMSGVGGLDMQHAMAGETLSVDSLTMQLVAGDIPDRFIAADQTEDDWIITADGFELVAHGEDKRPTAVTNGAGQLSNGEYMIGQYYLTELHRKGIYNYALTFYSAIWLLEQSWHMGGLYTGQLAGDILDDIIGDVPHTIDDDFSTIQVYGYLPYAKCRANLQLLLMAIGGAVRNANDGSLRITSLTSTVAGVFDTDRVFIGGSVVDKNPATAVQVTEHNYLTSTETVTLFSDSTTNSETVIFGEPYHNLQITGGTITASGVNFCTFTGAGAVTLTGQKYTHVTRIITSGTAPTGSPADSVKTVTGNTLLTPNNAAIVADKLFDYLSNAQSITAEVVFGTERPGDVVSVVHPYTRELVDACAKSMSITFGATELRAMCEFLIGYVPPGAIGGFAHYVVLTGSGTWTVPAGVTRIRPILIGAGDGGAGGQPGGVSTGYAAGGPGGAAGALGTGGLIYETDLNVTPGETINYSSGSAGNGGSSGSAGTSGGATTFGGYSSTSGRRYPYGYSEPKSGLTFCVDGTGGAPGGNGSSLNGIGAAGTNVTYGGSTYTPGSCGTNYIFNSGEDHITLWGGGGGGPAIAANGDNGTNAGTSNPHYAGPGGNGATSTVPGATGSNYGQGGNGGNGGGGGGAGGILVDSGQIYDWVNVNGNGFVGNGDSGSGGAGSQGGNGGPGAIIIYY